jgi:molybdenum cofactor cytidylyltransferase
MLEAILAGIEASPIEQCVVVTGFNPGPIEERLANHLVRLVRNEGYAAGGMLSSIRVGMAGDMKGVTGVMVFPGDQPEVAPALIAAMIDRFEPGRGDIIVPVHEGRRGHPLLFDAGYHEELQRDFDDVGLRGLFTRYPERVTVLPWEDRGVLLDIDTPEDYERARGRR